MPEYIQPQRRELQPGELVKHYKRTDHLGLRAIETRVIDGFRRGAVVRKISGNIDSDKVIFHGPGRESTDYLPDRFGIVYPFANMAAREEDALVITYMLRKGMTFEKDDEWSGPAN